MDNSYSGGKATGNGNAFYLLDNNSLVLNGCGSEQTAQSSLIIKSTQPYANRCNVTINNYIDPSGSSFTVPAVIVDGLANVALNNCYFLGLNPPYIKTVNNCTVTISGNKAVHGSTSDSTSPIKFNKSLYYYFPTSTVSIPDSDFFIDDGSSAKKTSLFCIEPIFTLMCNANNNTSNSTNMITSTRINGSSIGTSTITAPSSAFVNSITKTKHILNAGDYIECALPDSNFNYPSAQGGNSFIIEF